MDRPDEMRSVSSFTHETVAEGRAGGSESPPPPPLPPLAGISARARKAGDRRDCDNRAAEESPALTRAPRNRAGDSITRHSARSRRALRDACERADQYARRLAENRPAERERGKTAVTIN